MDDLVFIVHPISFSNSLKITSNILKCYTEYTMQTKTLNKLYVNNHYTDKTDTTWLKRNKKVAS